MQMMSAPRLTKGSRDLLNNMECCLNRLSEIQEEPLVMKWVRGEISNFSYLMALNHFAGIEKIISEGLYTSMLVCV